MVQQGIVPKEGEPVDFIYEARRVRFYIETVLKLEKDMR